MVGLASPIWESHPLLALILLCTRHKDNLYFTDVYIGLGSACRDPSLWALPYPCLNVKPKGGATTFGIMLV